jgi:type IV secretory pathway VirJ component
LIALLILLAGLAGVPLREFPAKTNGDTIAIVLTGDGGWRRIDDKLTQDLRAHGVSVVGFLTPDYFETRRTPLESSRALERTIRYYQTKWHRRRVILIGYSRGADVLPFMANRLSPELQHDIDLIALLGLESTIDFKYHASWIPFYHPKEPEFPVKPEVEKLRGQKILCVYGEKEKDTLCKALDPSLAMVVKTKGAHHFAGNYKKIAEAIVDASSIGDEDLRQ